MKIRAGAHPQPRDTQRPKAAKRLVLRVGVENQRQISQVHQKSKEIFHVLSNVEKNNAIEKGIIFFQSYLYLWCSNNYIFLLFTPVNKEGFKWTLQLKITTPSSMNLLYMFTSC